jgi:hypothetical protein
VRIRHGFLNPNERMQIRDAAEMLDSAPMRIVRYTGASATDLNAVLDGHDLVVIDDLFHMVGTRDGALFASERAEVRAILAELKDFAVTSGAAVLVTWDPRAPARWSATPERRLKYIVRFLRSAMRSVDSVLSLNTDDPFEEVWVEVMGYSCGRGGFLLRRCGRTWHLADL